MSRVVMWPEVGRLAVDPPPMMQAKEPMIIRSCPKAGMRDNQGSRVSNFPHKERAAQGATDGSFRSRTAADSLSASVTLSSLSLPKGGCHSYDPSVTSTCRAAVVDDLAAIRKRPSTLRITGVVVTGGL
ncbi:hypothetical protein E4U56_006896 [Claviceps arundinis]|uniref:Uncharacterized protein n=1 Tax=Claviceps arundinis TaxID=1623583 RepID=A0A9P7N0B9_9HYPO|nr:hypothetical protein E4U56_006896 [Claviceps arundinis]